MDPVVHRALVAAFAALVVAAAAGSIHAAPTSQPFLLVLAKGPDAGTTTPTGADALAEVAQAGATTLKVGPATTPWTDADIDDANTTDRAALAHNLSTWVNLSTVSRATAGSTSDALLARVVGSLTTDAGAPAIGLWKGADEPFWSGFSPASLQFTYCRTTGRGDPSWCGGEPVLDSAHPFVTIEAPRGTAAQLQPYSAVTDVHGVDIYPVTLAQPTPNLHDVGTWTSTIASVTPSANVWTTLQVCASGSYDTSGHYVLPTLAQERYMAYDAVLNGARTLAFYGGNIAGCWSDSDRQRGWNWTFWSTVLKPLLAELNSSSALAPALANPGSTRTLTTSDSTTQAISRSGANGDVWVIAARSGAGTANVTIGGLPASLGNGTVYTEGRTVTATNGSFTDAFAQWGVHVYRFAPAPPPPTTTATTTTTTTAVTTTTPAPPPPPPSSGGGGGGGGTPNLGVRLATTASSVTTGAAVDVNAYVRNTGSASSTSTHLVISLPPGLALVAPPYYERGSGCTGTQQLDCNLDFLPNGTETRVAFEVHATAAGSQAIAATASGDRDSDASDNAASATIDVTAPAAPATVVVPVKRVALRTFHGTAHADRIVGTPRDDVIYGLGGNDVLIGGNGKDVLYGGRGNDTLRARDRERDVVDCGPGRDVAIVDRLDRVTGCETVRRP